MCELQFTLYREIFEEATGAQANRFAAKGEETKVSQLLDALITQDEKLKKALHTGEATLTP